MLTEVTAYYEQLRREQAATTSVIHALCFDATATLLASGTTTSQLTVHSLPTAAAQPVTRSDAKARLDATVAQYDLSMDGAINELCSTNEHLFIATDVGVRVLDWSALDSDAVPPLAGKTLRQINALAPLAHAHGTVVAASADGSLLRIDGTTGTVETLKSPPLSGGPGFVYAVAASPTDRYCILTVSLSLLGYLCTPYTMFYPYDSLRVYIYQDNNKFINKLMLILSLFPQGCDDGIIRQYDLRRSKGLVREMEISPATTSRTTCGIYFPSVVFNSDGTYAMLASSERSVSSLHIASGTVIASQRLPFIPRAIALSSSTFYIGGSDRRVGHASTIPNFLAAFDVLCKPMPNAPVSAGSVYAVVAHPTKGILAAAGFTPAVSPMPTKRLIDVYIDPPVRSFSISI